MICIKCNKQIDDDSKFCIHCGSVQNQNTAQREISNADVKLGQTSKNNHTLIIILGVLTVIIIIVLTVSNSEKRKSTYSNNINNSQTETATIDKTDAKKDTPNQIIESEKNISKSVKDFFFNKTYQFDGQSYVFNNGKFESDLPAYADLENIIKTNFSGLSNEYTLYFYGAWGGGNSGWGYVLVVRIQQNQIIKIFETSCSQAPIINENEMSIIHYKWLEDDPHCCPSRQVITKYVWENSNFVVSSKHEEKKD
ncbi:zinc-ribbon domain-containing protein [Mariniphaga sp.]|uniref:zinc-ribbon domain-containing protein n=1 Tax=Mariniphaga sp. TaxID=1954475 RepID=UPI00356A814B